MNFLWRMGLRRVRWEYGRQQTSKLRRAESVLTPLESRRLLAGVSFSQPPALYNTGLDPLALTPGHFNGDSFLDLATANFNAGTVSVFINNKDGSFASKHDYACGSSPSSIVAADLNGDGKSDLAVCNEYINKVTVLLNNGSGAFPTQKTYDVGVSPRAITAADFSGDGKPDIATGNYGAVINGTGGVTFLTNNGSGLFPTSSNVTIPSNVTCIAADDFTGDRQADLAVGASYDLCILSNQGGGSFALTDYFGHFPTSLVAADLNGDSQPDLVVGNGVTSTPSMDVIFNQGGNFNTSFGFAKPSIPSKSVAVADFNGDQKPDIAVFYKSQISVLLNQDNGRWGNETLFTTADPTQSPFNAGLIAADLNNDAMPDLAAAQGVNATMAVLLNSTPAPFVDPNDQISEAFVLGPMTSTQFIHLSATPHTPVAMSIDDPREVDMFAFSVTAGQRIGFNIDLPADSSLDSYLRLFDSSGTQLAFNDNAGAPGEPLITLKESYLEYTFATGGTYYIGVSGSGNSAYDAVTGAGDNPGSTGTYFLIASPGLAGIVSGDVGLGPQTFVVDILRDQNGAQPIITTPGTESWIVTHGRVSSRNSAPVPDIPRLVNAVKAQRPGAQVLTLDWSGPADAGDIGLGVPDLRQEDWIVPVAQWAAAALNALGFGQNLNLIGHSWGANLSDEVAKRIPSGVNTIVALDPAADGPSWLNGGQYDPDTSVDFAAPSRFAWAFLSRDGATPMRGDPLTAATADEAILVTNSEHSEVVNLFSWMLEFPTVGASPYFQLDRLMRYEPGPWVPDSYTQFGGHSVLSGNTFEAILPAAESGVAAPIGPQFIPLQSSGSLNIGSATEELDASRSYDAITIAAGGRLVVDPDGSNTLRTAALSIAPGGVLDLNDNDLIIDYPDASPAPNVAALLAAGRNGGAWNGSGIASSTASAHPGMQLGYAQSSLLFSQFPANFDGQQIDNSAIVVRYTIAGDANLDRAVNFGDLVAVAQHYGATGGAAFSDGDFDYDGNVAFADLVAVAQKYGTGLSAPAAGALPAVLSSNVDTCVKPIFSVTPIARPRVVRPKRQLGDI